MANPNASGAPDVTVLGMNPDTWERVVCADLGRKLDICFLMGNL